MKILKTTEYSLSHGPSKNSIVWRHSDVIIGIVDVIMTSYDDIFAGAQTQTVLLGFRNLHAKNLAFSSMCEILLLFNTVCLHYISTLTYGKI